MLVVIQARFSSARLPGKVLRPLAGKPMLGWVIDRLRAAQRVTRIVVATSTEASDDPVAAYCGQEGVDCFRGSLHDVAGRLAAAADWANAEAFVRVSGDSPLMLPSIVDAVIEAFDNAKPDLATNVQRRTFPKGLSAEAVALAGLRRARALLQPGEEEHVTGPFYRCPEQFRIVNLISGHDWGALQLSVDTADDFALVERMLMRDAHFGPLTSVADLIDLRERCFVPERT
jgi:spore coat polysaccharide biosynthesis protein SpsF